MKKEATLISVIFYFLRGDRHGGLDFGNYLRNDIIVRTQDGLVVLVRRNSDDSVNYLTSKKPWTRKWFRPREGETVLDCGSSVGSFSILAARSGSKVISFEANPEVFQVLYRNIELNSVSGNIKPFNVALADEVGTAKLSVPGEGSGAGTIVTKYADDFKSQKRK